MLAHNFKGSEILQDGPNGMVNLTQMAKAGGKDIHEWLRSAAVKQTLTYLESDRGISPITPILVVKGNSGNRPQGTWGLPQLAIKLAMWVSPEFEYWALTTLVNIIQEQAQQPPAPDVQDQLKLAQTQLLLAQTQLLLAQTIQNAAPQLQPTPEQQSADSLGRISNSTSIREVISEADLYSRAPAREPLDLHPEAYTAHEWIGILRPETLRTRQLLSRVSGALLTWHRKRYKESPTFKRIRHKTWSCQGPYTYSTTHEPYVRFIVNREIERIAKERRSNPNMRLR
jgi:hypothetical protein